MKNVIKRIMTYAKPYIKYLIPALIFSLGGVMLSLFVPILSGKAVDCIVSKGNVDFNEVVKIISVLGVIIILSGVLQWLASLCTNKLSYYTIRDIRFQIFKKLNYVPLKYIDGSSKGDIISRCVNDTEIVSDGLMQGFTQLFTSVFTILGTLIFMLTISVKITLIVVILTPLSFFTASGITRLTKKSFSKQAEIRGRFTGFTEEMVGSQNIVKSFAYEKRAEEEFDKINSDLGEIGVKATFFSSMTNPTTRFINGLIYAAVGLFGALSVLNGRFSIGNLVSFLTYSNQYTKPFNEISGVIAEFQNAVASAERIFMLIDEPSEPGDSNLPDICGCDGSVNFKDVNFSYRPDVPLIQNFNLNVKSGQRIAIVGPTGCGKTTIINLLMRFYDVNSGNISLNGNDIRNVTRKSLHLCFGMVLQDTWLFTGTVAENIAYSRPDAAREEIINAAKAVHAHGFIERLPKGYDTVLENGGGLSQGQKQLISIARIMLANPPILILDEATSSIDIRTEMRIQRAFEKLMKGKTSFIIAHRLSTIKNADTILVMKDGNIIEHGSHRQLIEQNGFYADLYNSQFASV